MTQLRRLRTRRYRLLRRQADLIVSFTFAASTTNTAEPLVYFPTTKLFIKGIQVSDVMRQLGKILLNGLFILILITIALACGIWLGRDYSVWREPTKIHSIPPTVIQLERLGELTAMRVHVTDVLWAEGEGYRGSWLISGDALLSCDVTRAVIKNLNPVARTATIRLPRLQVVSARIDHDKTKTWSVEKTTWLPWRWGDQGVMRDAAMSHAQKLIETAAGSAHHLNAANTQAEVLIRQIYDFVNWKVEVEWE